jgi:hypothetical protein
MNEMKRSRVCSTAGLPDGIFSDQKSLFGYILKGITMKAYGLFYGHSVYFTAIWYILLLFGFSRFGMFYQEKSGNPTPKSGQPLLLKISNLLWCWTLG